MINHTSQPDAKQLPGRTWPFQVTGSLVEYVIIGSVSATWIGLLLSAADIEYGTQHVIIVAPLLYVLGMVSDYLGHVATRRLKKRIEVTQFAAHRIPAERFSTGRLLAHLAVGPPVLAAHLKDRSSRDRIARGTLANIPLIGVAALYWLTDQGNGIITPMAATAIIALTSTAFFVVYLMWQRFQLYSVQAEIHAQAVLKEMGIDTLISLEELRRKKEKSSDTFLKSPTHEREDSRTTLDGREDQRIPRDEDEGKLEREHDPRLDDKAWLAQPGKYWSMNKAAYDALDPNLLEQHRGEYAVFYRGRFLGFGSDEVELGRRVIEEHGVDTEGMGFIEVGVEYPESPPPLRRPRMGRLD